MKFSVIVPVYRTKKYLDQCVLSVLQQSTPDLELILVDDHCPDGCGELCDGYAAQDPRVKVIHMQANVGLGFARNAGLEAAQGDFILFLDSDDWLDPEALSAFEDLTDEDMLVFGTTFVHEKDGRREVRVPAAVETATARENPGVFAMLNRAKIFQFAWNKVYRREFLLRTGIRFEQTKMIEDFLFNIALLPQAQRIRCIPQALHFYRKPAHETLASSYCEDFFDLCKRKFTLESAYLSQAAEYRPLICDSFLRHLISAVIRNSDTKAGLSPRAQREKLRQMLRDPVTAQAMDGYFPSHPVYRLLKSWVCKERVGLLFLGCRLFKFIQK